MLQSIREKTSGWIATVVLGLIILALGVFGLEGYLGSQAETYVARIESPAEFLWFGKETRDITSNEFRTRFEQVRQQERQEKGEAFDAAAFESLQNKREVLEQLIDQALLDMVSGAEGMALPNSAVARRIAGYQAFQVDGKFNPDRYLMVLQGQGMTPKQFEEMQRAELLRGQIPEALLASQFASDAELDAYLRLSRQTRDLQVLEIPVPADGPPPSDAQLQAWYSANASRYRSPEQVAIEYVEINAASLPVDTVADEQTLRDRYESVKSRYGTLEQKMGSHILLALDPGATPAQVSAAQAKAADIVRQARLPNADFAALARQYSDDPGSRDAGGDLGPIEKGVFGDAFDQAFAALQPGQVSDPVRLPDGFHILFFRERIAGNAKPFEDVRAEVEAEFLESERERAFNDISGKLVDLVYADPGSLAPAAKQLDLPVQRTGLFTRATGEGVAALEPVRKAAFSDPQKVDRQVSDPIEIEPNHVVVLRVTDHKPAAPLPLASIRERVMADLMADRRIQAAKVRAEALLARAQKGESLDTLGLELERPVAVLPGTTREAPNPQLQPLLDEAFRLSRPAAGKPEVGLAQLANGRFALVAVTAVADGDLKSLDAATRTTLRDQLAQIRGAVDARAFISGLRKQYEITIAEDRL